MLPSWAVFAGLILVVPGAVYRQAPPGPLPAAQPQPGPAPAAKPQEPPPRTTILGAWKLNPDDSDDPQKRRPDSSRGSGRGMGGGYPGGGRGGYGRRGGESDEERQKMHELFTPAKAITLSMTGAEVDLVGDRDRKRAFMTDGRKLQKSKDDRYQEIAAKWEDRKSTRLNSSHSQISYAVFCLKKKKTTEQPTKTDHNHSAECFPHIVENRFSA